MKIKRPEPFTFQAGPRAVLLLHGFTGHTADVRMLGRFLEKKGYTSHAPIYRGHGGSAEDIASASAAEWWEDVNKAYEHLKELGYEEIAVAGLSLGGVLALKLAYSNKVKAVLPMCAPMFFDNEEQLTAGFIQYARTYKQLEGKSAAEVDAEVNTLMDSARTVFQELGHFVEQVRDETDAVYAPAFVIQARQDKMINPESAHYIYDHIQSDEKDLKWYEKSGHVITLGPEREQLHEDIYQFLERLNWEDSN